MKDVERFNAWEEDRVRKIESKRQVQQAQVNEEELRFRPQTNRKPGDKPRTTQ